MRILDFPLSFTVIVCIGFGVVFNSYADTIYVDNKLTVSSTKTYSIRDRNGKGSNGRAFNSIQMALDSMTTGDVICIRGGVYTGNRITISNSKNGTSWNTGKFNTMMSFPGEWAIIDGQRKLTQMSGSTPYLLGNTTSNPLKFWRFERLEIRNGASADGKNAYGFFGNQGPFHFRYCVIRDNIVDYEGNNPAGIAGYTWMDCVVEYCYFYNNGAVTNHRNSCHLVIFSDYDNEEHAKNGFVNKNLHTMGNCYRYNLFVSASGPAVAIKYKNDTFLSGRNPSEGHGYDDTWKNRGDRIYKNIFRKSLDYAVSARQDFVQVYNNIFDSCFGAIAVGDWWKATTYKATVYNNTVRGKGAQGLFFSHYKQYPYQEQNIIQYAYNNIVDNCGDDWDKDDITLEWDPQFTSAVVDSFRIDRNIIYRPSANKYDANGTYVFWFGSTANPSTRYTISTYKNIFPDSRLYYAKEDAANPLFSGTSGANRLITRGEYKLSDKENIANSGKNISHPFLSGVKIPGYIGATDPNDNKWVSVVLNLVNLDKNEIPDLSSEQIQQNNAPVVSLVSAADNANMISDSVVRVRWKTQDDQGIRVCSLFVSINDSSFKLITANNNSIDSILWKIPDNAKTVKFMVRAYDAQRKYGELTSMKYQVSIYKNVNRQLRLYVFTIDGSRIYSVWGKYQDAPSFQRVAIVCRTDRFAISPVENGNKVYYSGLTRGNSIIDGFNPGQAYYVSIFGELTPGSWSACCDSIRIVNSSRVVSAKNSFTDTIYVPEDGSDSVRYALSAYKGNNNASAKGSIQITNKIEYGKRAIEYTVPSTVVCDTSGFYAYFIRSTSKYTDTVRISRPVKRINNNFDNFSNIAGKKHPVSVTALPVKSGLASTINYLKSPVSLWSYDKARAIITQFRPVDMLNSKSIYYEYGQIADSFFNPVPGRLFWVQSNEVVKFDFGQAIIPAHYQDYNIRLNSGWTHFALPIAVPITLRKIMTATETVWSEAMFDSLEIYRWRETTSGYSVQSIHLPGMKTIDPESVVLNGGPGTGYAIYNKSKNPKTLVLPVQKNQVQYLAKAANTDKLDSSGWSICLNACLNNGDSLPSAYFGYSPESESVTYQPVPSFDEIRLLIKDAKSGENCSNLLINKIDQEQMSFDVALVNSSNKDDTVIFAIGAITGLPKNINLIIKDGRDNQMYSGTDSVIVELGPEQTVYLTIEATVPTPVHSNKTGERKSGISKFIQNRLTNSVKLEFYSIANVNKAMISIYTLNGQAVIRENLHTIRNNDLQVVDLSLAGHNMSNGRYIIKLTMIDKNGKEEVFKAPLLLMNN